MQCMGVAPGRSYDKVIAASKSAGLELSSNSKNSAGSVGMGSLLLVPAGSFEVCLFKHSCVSATA